MDNELGSVAVWLNGEEVLKGSHSELRTAGAFTVEAERGIGLWGYSYGLYSYACIVMAYIVMAYIVMPA